jgi:outer membrane protein insertion porin family
MVVVVGCRLWNTVAKLQMFVWNGQAMFRRLFPVMLLSCVVAVAQRAPIAAKLVNLHVQGTTRYSEAEVLAALPLHTGQTVTPNDFKAAADSLLAGGAFKSVGYEYAPAGTGYAVTFKVEDESRWIRVGYANFLWFTPDELDKAIRQQVPLYRGEVPLEGGMIEPATAALQQLITKRGIPGTVQFLHTATLSGPVTGGKFVIQGLEMKITQVDVTGGGPEQTKLEDTANARLRDTSFDQDEANAIARLNLLPIAETDGYIRANVGEVTPKLTNSDVQHPTVAVTVPVTLGEQYTLSDIIFSGNQVLAAADLRNQIPVKTGAAANGVQINEGLENVNKLYGTRGYLMARAKSTSETDDAKHSVVYRVDISEGAQFHMGKLQITGVNPEGTSKLTGMWRLKPGDTYSTDYVKEYLHEVSPLIPRTATIKVASNVNPQTKSVDVTLEFAARQAER